MNQSKRKVIAIILAAVGICIGGYLLFSGAGTEEERVILVLEEAITGIENQAPGEVLEHIHPDYKDSYKNDRSKLEGFLKLLLVVQRRKFSIGLIDPSVTIDGEVATVICVIDGNQRSGGSDSRQFDATIELRKVDGDWLVSSVMLKRRTEGKK